MTNYSIRIEIPDGEVKRLLDELTAAQETIYNCYDRLEALGVVTIKKGTSAATDAPDNSNFQAR